VGPDEDERLGARGREDPAQRGVELNRHVVLVLQRLLGLEAALFVRVNHERFFAFALEEQVCELTSILQVLALAFVLLLLDLLEVSIEGVFRACHHWVH